MPIINSAASSAMQAWQQALSVTANNVANINTEGFQPDRPSFQEAKNGGVTMTAEPTGDSEVSLGEEMVRLTVTTNGYQANLKAVKAQDEMNGTILNLLG